MNLSKSRSNTPKQNLTDLNDVFRALAHAFRRQILRVLKIRDGEMTAGKIADRFSCSWPTTTRHLRVLENAALITLEKRGRERVFRLNEKRLVGVTSKWLNWFFEHPSPTTD